MRPVFNEIHRTMTVNYEELKFVSISYQGHLLLLFLVIDLIAIHVNVEEVDGRAQIDQDNLVEYGLNEKRLIWQPE